MSLSTVFPPHLADSTSLPCLQMTFERSNASCIGIDLHDLLRKGPCPFRKVEALPYCEI